MLQFDNDTANRRTKIAIRDLVYLIFFIILNKIGGEIKLF
ncbi:hypothetical protein HJ01_00803 [Flavobacterium frigoris PS1]|uniref:Uncharacterized protein n=1 Tax=Flavobacterium frigoris (strain PS1) TaxID=1086011 RepID=H7FMY7_FLAFP|nr:hypothetical protein HJ01_00803 [Flavobacterium frigoris PS1]